MGAVRFIDEMDFINLFGKGFEYVTFLLKIGLFLHFYALFI